MPTNRSLRFPLALNLAKTYVIDQLTLRRAMILVIGSAALLLPIQTYGQQGTIQYTHNKPDQTLRSAMRVDPSTLGLSIEVPIANYPGRGGTSVPVSLSYSSKQWRIDFEESWLSNGGLLRTESIPMFSEWAKAGWTSAAEIPIIEWTGFDQQYNSDGTPFCGCGTTAVIGSTEFKCTCRAVGLMNSELMTRPPLRWQLPALFMQSTVRTSATTRHPSLRASFTSRTARVTY